MKTITFRETTFTLTAPMEGPELGCVFLGIASPVAVFTLDELDVLRDRLAFVHTSIEHIQKHGLLPVGSEVRETATPDSDQPLNDEVTKP